MVRWINFSSRPRSLRPEMLNLLRLACLDPRWPQWLAKSDPCLISSRTLSQCHLNIRKICYMWNVSFLHHVTVDRVFGQSKREEVVFPQQLCARCFPKPLIHPQMIWYNLSSASKAGIFLNYCWYALKPALLYFSLCPLLNGTFSFPHLGK